MRSSWAITFFLFIFLHTIYAQTYRAVARIFGTTSSPSSYGLIFIDVNDTATNLTFEISGIESGSRAIYIHNAGDVSSDDGSSLGPIYNPLNSSRGCYPNTREIGAVLNVNFPELGALTATYTINNSLPLSGNNSIIGRAISIYAATDDCVSSPSGLVFAQGIIGIYNDPSNLAVNPINFLQYGDWTFGAAMKGPEGGVSGTVWFRYLGAASQGYQVQVAANISGLNPNSNFTHGLNIRTYGDFRTHDAQDSLEHYNPYNTNHALPSEGLPRHAGDLGNIVVSTDRRASFNGYFDLIKLDGNYSILGRGVAITTNTDLGSAYQPYGGTPGRVLAFGVIGSLGGNKFPIQVDTTSGPLDAYSIITGTTYTTTIYPTTTPIPTTTSLPTATSTATPGTTSPLPTSSDTTTPTTTTPTPTTTTTAPTVSPTPTGTPVPTTTILTNATTSPSPVPTASPLVSYTNVSQVNGTIWFHQDFYGSILNLTYNISGLTPGLHAISINTFGDATSIDGSSLGPRFNPNNNNFGCYPAPRRVGDLGNIIANSQGIATGSIFTELATLYGNNSVLGRGVAIYALPDICPNSNSAGAIVAQGTIGIKNVLPERVVAPNNTAILVASLLPSSSLINSSINTSLANASRNGSIYFRVSGQQVEVYARFNGLPANQSYALQIHRFGDLSDFNSNGTNLGSTWNPTNATAGLPGVSSRRAGDLGNVVSQSDGNIYYHRYLDLLTLGGVNGIVGRSVVIHQFSQLPLTGNQTEPFVGNALVSGVIGLSNLSSFPTIVNGPDDFKGPFTAYVTVYNNYTNQTLGNITITQTQATGLVTFNYSFQNLTAGRHGLLLRTLGDIFSQRVNQTDFSVGSVFNPLNATSFSCYPNSSRPVGVIGTINVSNDGLSNGILISELIELYGVNSIIGHIIEVTSLDINCSSGAWGSRDAWGVVGIANVDSNGAVNSAMDTNATILVARIFSVPTFSIPNVTLSPSGVVFFSYGPNRLIQVTAYISGLVPYQQYGFHIHQFGDTSFNSNHTVNVGSHYNPTNFTHALPSEQTNRHVGDLGNVVAQSDGRVYLTTYFDTLPLGGINSIVGRSVVIHTGPDQGQSQQPNGGSGDVLGYGVIGVGVPNSLPNVTAGPDVVSGRQYGATVSLTPLSSATILPNGVLRLRQAYVGAPVYVDYNITLPSNRSYGLRFQTYGDIRTGNTTGSVWNPFNGSIGCPPSTARRVGDLGTITGVNMSGTYRAVGFLIAESAALYGNNSLIGRSIALYDTASNCMNDTGSVLAQGVIGITDSGLNPVPAQIAVAVIRSPRTTTTAINGVIWFRVLPGGQQVQVYANISGLTAGAHGLQIRVNGDISNNFNNTGAHLTRVDSTTGVSITHGLPIDITRHDGDMGNIQTQSTGVALLNRYFDLISLGGNLSIIGRSILVFANPDQGRNAADGGVGYAVAGGVIGLTNATFPELAPGPDDPVGPFYGVAQFGLNNSLLSSISGTIRFVQDVYRGFVNISYNLAGLPAGGHAIHIHTYGDLSSVNGTAAGPILASYNVTGLEHHGCFPQMFRSPGDLIANITADSSGVAVGSVLRDLIDMNSNISIIGRAVIITRNVDSCRASDLSPGGPPIAQAVIGIGNPSFRGLSANNAQHPGIPNRNFTLRAELYGTAGYGTLTGVAWARPYFRGTIQIAVLLYNTWPSSVHGVHIHTFGDLSSFVSSNESIGTHYNPTVQLHGLPNEETHHLGDMGNALADGNGKINMNNAFPGLTLSGVGNLIGRAISIKAAKDQGAKVQPDGQALDTIAVGVWGVSAQAWTSGEPNYVEIYPAKNSYGVALGVFFPLLFIAILGVTAWYTTKKSQFNRDLIEVADKEETDDLKRSGGGDSDEEEPHPKSERKKEKKSKEKKKRRDEDDDDDQDAL